MFEQPDLPMREPSIVLHVSALAQKFVEEGTLNSVAAHAMIGIATVAILPASGFNTPFPDHASLRLIAGHHRFAAHVHLSPGIDRSDLTWLVKVYSPG